MNAGYCYVLFIAFDFLSWFQQANTEYRYFMLTVK